MIMLTLALAHASPALFVHGAGWSDAQSSPSTTTLVAIDGDTAWVTLWMELRTEPDLVGMLIPVPSDFDLSAVRYPDDTIDNPLEQHTDPRVHAYECSTEVQAWDTAVVDGGAWEDDKSSAEAVLMDPPFELELGTPADVEALSSWLSSMGLELPEGGGDLLEPHLDAGSAVLLAWRDTQQAGSYRSTPALQLPLPVDDLSLNFSLSTPNASSTLGIETVYTVVPEAMGRPVLDGWAEAAIDFDCLWEAEGDISLDEDLFESRTSAVADVAPGFLVDHAALDGARWDHSSVGDPLSADQLATVGYGLDQGPYFLTRLTLSAGTDAAIAFDGDGAEHLPRYASYDASLVSVLPVCFQGWETPTAPTCDQVSEGDGGDKDPSSGGCSAAPAAGVWSLLLAAAVLLRRRRSVLSRAQSPT